MIAKEASMHQKLELVNMYSNRARAEAKVTLLELSEGQWKMAEINALTNRLEEEVGAQVSFCLQNPRFLLIAGDYEREVIAEILKDFGRSDFHYEKVQGYDNQRLPWRLF